MGTGRPTHHNQGQEKIRLASPDERKCGSCKLCCIALEIESKPGYSTRLDTHEDLSKPAGKVCPYLGEEGCQIYEVRPVVCRRFACDWLARYKGLGPQDSPLLTNYIGVRGNRIEVGRDLPLNIKN